MKYQAVILAGGFGTRLKSIFSTLPKPLVPVSGVPILEYQLRECLIYGLNRIVLVLHYQSDLIVNFLKENNYFGMDIKVIIEKVPNGTGGALLEALPILNDEFLVIYADTYFKIDISSFISVAKRKNSNGILLVHPNDHPNDSDIIEMNEYNEIIRISKYPHDKNHDLRNIVNAGMYWFNDKKCLEITINRNGKSDLAKDIFPKLLASGFKLSGYMTVEYIKDMGTPQRLNNVELDIINELPKKLELKNKRKAIFIDRDGTINVEKNYITDPNQIELIENAGKAIRRLNENGVLAVCITNQPIIARGDIDLKILNNIHGRIDSLIADDNAYLDRIYFCPHHPDKGFIGENAQLKFVCNCRKPFPGLILKAVEELNIEISESWIVGDSTTDIKTGKDLNINTILLKTGYYGKDSKYLVRPDFIFDDLLAAVNFILKGYPEISYKINNVIDKIDRYSNNIILIGGPSNSGKTTVAKTLKKLIKKRYSNKNVYLFSCDSWLKPKNERVEGDGVLSRYSLDYLIKKINVLNDNLFCEILVPILDNENSKVLFSENVILNKEDIVIIEGVTTLIDKNILGLSNLRIYVDADEDIRRTRFINEYKSRGMSFENIEKLYKSRHEDEFSIIKNNINVAEHIVYL